MKRAFTLIELLVVVSVVMFLVGLLAAGLAGARSAARATVCQSNIRQLHIAADLYADDHAERLPPGAPDFLVNLVRWHGTRRTTSDPFTPHAAPLTPYLNPGQTGESTAPVRTCPEFARTASDLADSKTGFERSCGGYSYNNAYAGVSRRRSNNSRWPLVSDLLGSPRPWFLHPFRNVLFADGALATGQGPIKVIEYSFAEPRFWPHKPTQRTDPSIHFRHQAKAGLKSSGNANIAWLDGHVSAERMTFSIGSGVYECEPGEAGVGWFGEADDNSLFAYR